MLSVWEKAICDGLGRKASTLVELFAHTNREALYPICTTHRVWLFAYLEKSLEPDHTAVTAQKASAQANRLGFAAGKIRPRCRQS